MLVYCAEAGRAYVTHYAAERRGAEGGVIESCSILINVGEDGSQSSRPNLGWPVDKSLFNFLPLLRYPLLFSSVVVVGSF